MELGAYDFGVVSSVGPVAMMGVLSLAQAVSPCQVAWPSRKLTFQFHCKITMSSIVECTAAPIPSELGCPPYLQQASESYSCNGLSS